MNNQISQKELKKRLKYDKDTGVFTRVVAINKKVGTLTTCGYLRISIDRKFYQAHRLAWLYHYGSFPAFDIDHLNHDRLDNRISNLRDVSRLDNHHNQSIRTTNKSGVTGVHYHKSRKKWMAQITVNYKQIPLGRFKNKEDAITAREKANIKYNFHTNHGS